MQVGTTQAPASGAEPQAPRPGRGCGGPVSPEGTGGLDSVSWDSLTKAPKRGGLEQRNPQPRLCGPRPALQARGPHSQPPCGAAPLLATPLSAGPHGPRHPSVSPHCLPSTCLSLCQIYLLTRTLVTLDQGPPCGPKFNLITSVRTLFPNSHILRYWGLGLGHIFVGTQFNP